jgi:hypothetical protein
MQKQSPFQIIAEHKKNGHRENIDMYWFSWHYIKSINDQSDWKFYVYVNGSLVHVTEDSS